jgi:predicted lipid-binding transport protein (Tim44 family)
MNYSFEYIDIILLAMIAGFIFLRLRGILGKKTGFEGKITSLEKEFKKFNIEKKPLGENFDGVAQKNFLIGAKIAYETVITDFSDSDNKLIASKPLLGKKIYDQFKEALEDRKAKDHHAEITFIGIKSAIIKSHKKVENSLEVTVDFVSEIITCIKDSDKKIVSGSTEKIKTVYDTWVFSKNINSLNPNWLLIDIVK